MSASGSARGYRGEDADDVVVRKVDHGWVVGDEEVNDLTSAMVLADLFAADHEQATGQDAAAYAEGRSAGSGMAATKPEGQQATLGQANAPGTPRARFVPNKEIEAEEAQRLAVTVTQLEHALASRVRVEQAIGVLAERHRLRPREAFDLLRGAARSRGQKITDMSEDVVASTANPLLRLPDELARQAPAPKQRGLRRTRQ
jgi:hypothetical protein